MDSSWKRTARIDLITCGVFVVCLVSALVWYAARQPQTALAPESPADLVPIDLDGLSLIGDPETLAPHVRYLLEEMRSGHLLGSRASLHQRILEKADKVDSFEDGKSTLYRFYANPAIKQREGSPELGVFVQNRYDRIFKCGVGVPVY